MWRIFTRFWCTWEFLAFYEDSFNAIFQSAIRMQFDAKNEIIIQGFSWTRIMKKRAFKPILFNIFFFFFESKSIIAINCFFFMFSIAVCDFSTVWLMNSIRQITSWKFIFQFKFFSVFMIKWSLLKLKLPPD